MASVDELLAALKSVDGQIASLRNQTTELEAKRGEILVELIRAVQGARPTGGTKRISVPSSKPLYVTREDRARIFAEKMSTFPGRFTPDDAYETTGFSVRAIVDYLAICVRLGLIKRTSRGHYVSVTERPSSTK